jgi:hypothetical protein
MKTGKHVIFLGAGASVGSGYPLANDLRLLISSRDNWSKSLREYQERNPPPHSPVSWEHAGRNLWERHSKALKLFREGGFATLDEFCKLAGFAFQSEIHGLRNVVRAALGMFNPEEHFEKSEYYGFVQSLFNPDLLNLREDVSVLTYNYDPYLDFLLYRALMSRWKVTSGETPAVSVVDLARHKREEQQLNAVTSGFFDTLNQSWLGDENSARGFYFLKLHGSICYGKEPKGIDFDTLFIEEPQKRALKLLGTDYQDVSAPILFPWEVINVNGFVQERAFSSQYHNNSLYPLFSGIWQRAKREVRSADKISFVGLSMHQFLEDGLKYLFDGKTNETEIVVANRDNIPFMSATPSAHWARFPYSPGCVLTEMLNKVAPKMKRTGIVMGHSGRTNGEITLVKDFAEFVRTQMIPVKIDP